MVLVDSGQGISCTGHFTTASNSENDKTVRVTVTCYIYYQGIKIDTETDTVFTNLTVIQAYINEIITRYDDYDQSCNIETETSAFPAGGVLEITITADQNTGPITPSSVSASDSILVPSPATYSNYFPSAISDFQDGASMTGEQFTISVTYTYQGTQYTVSQKYSTP